MQILPLRLRLGALLAPLLLIGTAAPQDNPASELEPEAVCVVDLSREQPIGDDWVLLEWFLDWREAPDSCSPPDAVSLLDGCALFLDPQSCIRVANKVYDIPTNQTLTLDGDREPIQEESVKPANQTAQPEAEVK